MLTKTNNNESFMQRILILFTASRPKKDNNIIRHFEKTNHRSTRFIALRKTLFSYSIQYVC